MNTPAISDQIALVTGANAGMGLATVRALLAAGYRVAATDLRTDTVAALAPLTATAWPAS